MTNELKNKIYKFLADLKTDVDINACIDVEEIYFNNAYESIYEMIDNNNGFDIEITYYRHAMEYLMANDMSLADSVAIAHEYGYTTENLNSELLASLLASQNARTEFSDLENEINEFFESL